MKMKDIKEIFDESCKMLACALITVTVVMGAYGVTQLMCWASENYETACNVAGFVFAMALVLMGVHGAVLLCLKKIP